MRYPLILILLFSAVTSAAAHEYWFEPDSFFVKTGGKTNIHLYVGEALKMDEERPFQAAKTDSFQLFSNFGTFDLRSMAEDDKAPVLTFGGDKSGTYLMSMERSWSYITLESEKFKDYLNDEGMSYIIAERKKRGESSKDGRERYRRYLKTILQVGESHDASAKKRVGSRLEIVALDNPYTKKVGGKIKFQVFFDGFPLIDYAVFADNRDDKNYVTQKLTTDKKGKITVKLDHKGIWLVRLVYMQHCEKNCGDADWESFWGALSFGLR